MLNYRTRRTVQLADTDLTGFVHFSRLLVFAEAAEHDFLVSVIGDPFVESDGGRLGWPRRKITCSFKHPLAFGDEVDIDLIFRLGTASLNYSFTLHCGLHLVAEGKVALGCCLMDSHRGIEAIPIPSEIRHKLLIREQCGG
jgi:acyl-CoA thioester hydrolase